MKDAPRLIPKLFLLGAALLAPVLLFSAPAAAEGENKAPAPVRGGFFRTGLPGEAAGLDPIASAFSSQMLPLVQVYECLFSVAPDGRVEYRLAESAETSEDGLSMTVNLRRDVFFHRTTRLFKDDEEARMTSADVKASIERAASKVFYSRHVVDLIAGAREYYETAIDPEQAVCGKAYEIKGIETPNDSTVVFRLLKRCSILREILAMPCFSIASKKAIEGYGEHFEKFPIGTGPFQADSFTKKNLVLVRNPGYYRKAPDGKPYPYLERLIFSFEKDEESLLVNFCGGKYDYTPLSSEASELVLERGYSPGAPEAERGPVLKEDYPDFKLSWYVRPDAVFCCAMRLDGEPFEGNRYLRQAVNYAVRKKRIAASVRNGLAVVPHGFLPPGFRAGGPDAPGREPVYAYDPDKARELLEKAGYPGGNGLGEIALCYPEYDPAARTAMNLVYVDFEAIGLKCKLVGLDREMMATISEGFRTPFFYFAYGAECAHPYALLSALGSKSFPPFGMNYPRYSSRDYDALLGKVFADGGAEDVLRAEERLVEDAPVLFLFHSINLRLMRKEVMGLAERRYLPPSLETVWFHVEDDDDEAPDEAPDEGAEENGE